MDNKELKDVFNVEAGKNLTLQKIKKRFKELGLKKSNTGSSSQDGTTTTGQGIETNVYPQYIVFGEVLLM